MSRKCHHWVIESVQWFSITEKLLLLLLFWHLRIIMLSLYMYMPHWTPPTLNPARINGSSLSLCCTWIAGMSNNFKAALARRDLDRGVSIKVKSEFSLRKPFIFFSSWLSLMNPQICDSNGHNHYSSFTFQLPWSIAGGQELWPACFNKNQIEIYFGHELWWKQSFLIRERMKY